MVSTDQPMLGSFRGLLLIYIKRAGMNPMKYSRCLKHKSSGMVYLVLHGEKAPPLDRLDDWIEPLALSEVEKDALILRAIEDYSPPYVLRLINRMRFESRRWMELTSQAMLASGITPPPLPDAFRHQDDAGSARRAPAPPTR